MFMKNGFQNKRSYIMSKKKSKSQWKDYKWFTLKDGTKFLARDEHDANLYRVKVGEVASPYHGE